MLEQMSRELSELSSAYSAKCLENSVLDEKLTEAMAAVAEGEDDRSRYLVIVMVIADQCVAAGVLRCDCDRWSDNCARRRRRSPTCSAN